MVFYKIEQVLEKWFGDEKVRHYNAPDLIHSNHYLGYRRSQEYIILYIGSDEGEVLLQTFSTTQNGNALDELINILIYGVGKGNETV